MKFFLTSLRSYCQFHQHFTPAFFLQNFSPKITKLCFGFEVLAPKISYEKHTCITLMKLTPKVMASFMDDRQALLKVLFILKVVKSDQKLSFHLFYQGSV